MMDDGFSLYPILGFILSDVADSALFVKVTRKMVSERVQIAIFYSRFSLSRFFGSVLLACLGFIIAVLLTSKAKTGDKYALNCGLGLAAEDSTQPAQLICLS